MSKYFVELKKVVDDSYEIEIGYHLQEQLVTDIKNGLVGKIKKFALITDSTVRSLYADAMAKRLSEEGYQVEIFEFPAGEKSKTRKSKEMLEDAML